MAPSLLTLPLELQQQIYSYILCPGLIHLSYGTGPLGRPVPQINSITRGELCCSDDLSTDDQATIAEFREFTERSWAGWLHLHPSRYCAYQVQRTLARYTPRNFKPRVVDLSGVATDAGRRVEEAKNAALCKCAFCEDKVPEGLRPSRALELLLVCKAVYEAAQQLPFADNMFVFEHTRDFLRFLEAVGLEQRGWMRRVQVGWKVVVLLPASRQGGEKGEEI